MPGVIDYYFAPISGYAYLGHPGLMALAAETGATIRFKPLLIARVFAAADTTPPFAQADARRSYRIEDQARWAAQHGLAMNAVPRHWPTDPAPACKAILAAGAIGADQGAASFACLRAVWAEERDIAQPDQLQAALDDAGLNGADILAAADAPQVAAEMEAITDAAIAAQVFGSPTYVTGGARFWGQDRLPFLRAALLAEAA
ncbi:2-hydroxychromene-2-carboxylate isomerase [Actibacterium ureilyticum]|uniref:2-hydroxychromene-2-carboxylate isomerase n=1 Tax=Actibacterium ureilyticum TaxID=1590614 RepID=UPI000BAAF55D|nr:2-hydroxychromene-2-carboxylate isomerase [Actibacterium ureilyticum]